MQTPPSTLPSKSALAKICNVILDEKSSQQSLHHALDDYAQLCSQVTSITPNPTFNAWAKDTLLEQGVAINPQAAAYCIKDYQRSIMFIRGVHAAITTMLNKSTTIPFEILYAGCGPFATLLIPLLGKYQNDSFNLSRLNISLLDIHQKSLDSVSRLLSYFEICTNNINLIKENACTYQHPTALNLIIAETMQKSLEQEPQFTVTANLAPQLLTEGTFIPENIVVSLCLSKWHEEKTMHDYNLKIDHNQRVKVGKRYPLGTLLNLEPQLAATQFQHAQYNELTQKLELKSVKITIPDIKALETFDILFLTHIRVFEHYQLFDYESEITLPSKCETISNQTAGMQYLINYQLGSYPRFNVRSIQN